MTYSLYDVSVPAIINTMESISAVIDKAAAHCAAKKIDPSVLVNYRLAADMLATLEEEFPDLALLPAVPLSVRGAESVAERTSVLHYMPRSAVATAYRDVAAWIDTHDPAARPAQLAGARRA